MHQSVPLPLTDDIRTPKVTLMFHSGYSECSDLKQAGGLVSSLGLAPARAGLALCSRASAGSRPCTPVDRLPCAPPRRAPPTRGSNCRRSRVTWFPLARECGEAGRGQAATACGLV